MLFLDMCVIYWKEKKKKTEIQDVWTLVVQSLDLSRTHVKTTKRINHN